MNDPSPNFNTFPSSESKVSVDSVDAAGSEVPEFGLLDVIEAFTAMRHESRGQREESRQLQNALATAVEGIQSLESKLTQAAISQKGDGEQLVELAIELDIQLSRIVDTFAHETVMREQRADKDLNLLESTYQGLNGVSRWFAKPLWNVVRQLHQNQPANTDQPLFEGLQIVAANLRRMMNDCGVERFDTLSLPFDPETMNAIDNVAIHNVAAGCVAEQLTPGYRWQGKLVRFAQVRIAK